MGDFSETLAYKRRLVTMTAIVVTAVDVFGVVIGRMIAMPPLVIAVCVGFVTISIVTAVAKGDPPVGMFSDVRSGLVYFGIVPALCTLTGVALVLIGASEPIILVAIPTVVLVSNWVVGRWLLPHGIRR